MRDDMREGLRVIGGRSEALGRFMSSYAQLAKLPPPDRDRAARGGVGPPYRGPRAAGAGGGGTRPGPRDSRGRRPARSAAHQPGRERGRRGRRDGGRRAGALGARTGGLPGARGRGRRAGARADRQPVRAVLHDQAVGFGHRPGPRPADRGGARRKPGAREPLRRRRVAWPACGCRAASVSDAASAS